jgi:hypothetical protein
VTAGTVLHNTRTPLRLWFWAAYLMSTHTPGISAAQLQRQLGSSRYETAWLIGHKLRRAMVAPERAPLSGEAGVDEAFIGGHNPARRGGRDRIGKVLTAVAAEVRGPGTGRIRLQVLDDASGPSLQAFLTGTVAPGAIVHTDGWAGYQALPGAGYEHHPVKQRWRFADRQAILPRAHRAIANLKSWLEGTYHGTSAKHLQVYPGEFTFRHNRRHTPWPPSRPCSAWARCTHPPPTGKSRPEATG